MKHTKGEWIVQGTDVNYSRYVSCDKITIGLIYGPIITNHKNYIGVDEMEANAKLIAAAPNLLQAAIKCNREFDDPNDAVIAFKELDKAIKKATE